MKRLTGDPQQLFNALESLPDKGPVAVATSDLVKVLNCQPKGVYLRLRSVKEAGLVTVVPCRLKNHTGRSCSVWYIRSLVHKAVLPTQTVTTKRSIYV